MSVAVRRCGRVPPFEKQARALFDNKGLTAIDMAASLYEVTRFNGVALDLPCLNVLIR